MSSHSQSHRGHAAIVLFAAFAFLLIPTLSVAQDHTPKVEFFGGYSYFDSCGTLHATNPGAVLPLSICLSPDKIGIGSSLTYNFNRWLGLTGDFSGHWGSDESGVSKLHESRFYNISIGPKLTYRRAHFAPFVEALVGWHRLNSETFGSEDAIGFIGGGGIDIPLTRHFGLRLIQADYVFSNHQFDPSPVPTTEVRGVRLQSGVTVMFGGGTAQLPVTASCSGQPAEVMAGEPVKVTLTSSNFNPKRKLSYSWTVTGGKVAGTDTTATVDTTGLAPGSYTVNGKVIDNGKGKHQMSAACTANFSVLEPPKHPPTISCSANPTSVKSGDPSTITCQGSSPDNRPLSYAWTSTAGKVSGNDPTATLDTAGALAGPITINTTVSDDRNLTASTSSSVNVEVPPPPPTSSKINEIAFPDTRKPARVDNAAKAILDDVALRLQREADAKAVVIGYATADETKKKANSNLAAQRAFNTKDYLVKEKGIDPSRVEIRTGTGENQTAEIWLVPTGATFTGEGTTVVDESSMTAPAKKPVKKAKKAKVAPAQ